MSHPVRAAVLAYAGVILATIVGILGMGMLFTAIWRGHLALALVGVPLLVIGLYFAGQALGRGMAYNQRRTSK